MKQYTYTEKRAAILIELHRRPRWMTAGDIVPHIGLKSGKSIRGALRQMTEEGLLIIQEGTLMGRTTRWYRLSPEAQKIFGE